jgi:hypothetical protein
VLESATTGLVDDVLVWERVQFGDDVVAFFAANEESTEGSWVTDSETGRVVAASV